MSDLNTCVILKSRPIGIPTPEYFDIIEKPIASLSDGQVLVRTDYWSVEPAMRGWVNDAPNYSPPVPIGDVMRSFATGEVIESRDANFAVGDQVTGLFGWQTHAVVDGTTISRKITETDLPNSLALGVLGINGVTAYCGFLDLCKPKPGETVVVSTAAGAVGSAVGQLAKIHGCRTIGITSSAAKIDQCKNDFGFDEAISYKSPDFKTELARNLPDGVDCYFDNTSGAISDAVMCHLALSARITICGTAGHSDWDPIPMGPRVHRQMLVARAKMQGFLVFDHKERFPHAINALANWVRDGSLKYNEHILDGPAAATDAIGMLYRGENTGKLLVRV